MRPSHAGFHYPPKVGAQQGLWGDIHHTRLYLRASPVPGQGCPGLSTLKTETLMGKLRRPGSLVKTPCPPERGAEVGTDGQLQPWLLFLGSFTALL